MRFLRRSFSNLSSSTILLGRSGENNVTQLDIDVSKELSEFPESTFELIFTRPTEHEPYPVYAVSDGRLVSYIISGYDLELSGYGNLELIMYGPNGEVKKSSTTKTRIEDSIINGTRYPNSVQKWFDLLSQKQTDIEELINSLDVSDGRDGISPSVMVENIEGGNRIIITDKDHPDGQSFDVLNGDGGGKGATVVDVFSDLDADAASGSIAVVLEDDENFEMLEYESDGDDDESYHCIVNEGLNFSLNNPIHDANAFNELLIDMANTIQSPYQYEFINNGDRKYHEKDIEENYHYASYDPSTSTYTDITSELNYGDSLYGLYRIYELDIDDIFEDTWPWLEIEGIVDGTSIMFTWLAVVDDVDNNVYSQLGIDLDEIGVSTYAVCSESLNGPPYMLLVSFDDFESESATIRIDDSTVRSPIAAMYCFEDMTVSIPALGVESTSLHSGYNIIFAEIDEYHDEIIGFTFVPGSIDECFDIPKTSNDVHVYCNLSGNRFFGGVFEFSDVIKNGLYIKMADVWQHIIGFEDDLWDTLYPLVAMARHENLEVLNDLSAEKYGTSLFFRGSLVNRTISSIYSSFTPTYLPKYFDIIMCMSDGSDFSFALPNFAYSCDVSFIADWDEHGNIVEPHAIACGEYSFCSRLTDSDIPMPPNSAKCREQRIFECWAEKESDVPEGSMAFSTNPNNVHNLIVTRSMNLYPVWREMNENEDFCFVILDIEGRQIDYSNFGGYSQNEIDGVFASVGIPVRFGTRLSDIPYLDVVPIVLEPNEVWVGWNVDLEKVIERSMSLKPVTASTQDPLYGVSRIISFDPTDGTMSSTTITVSALAIQNNIVNYCFKDVPIPVCSGHKFIGWYTSGGIKIEDGDMIQINKDHTLFAKWKKE